MANIFCFQIRIICLFEEEMGVGSWLGCQVNKSLGAGKLRSNMLTFSRDCANFTTKQSWPFWDEKIATFFVPDIFFFFFGVTSLKMGMFFGWKNGSWYQFMHFAIEYEIRKKLQIIWYCRWRCYKSWMKVKIFLLFLIVENES